MLEDVLSVQRNDRDVVVVSFTQELIFVDVEFLEVKVHIAANGLELFLSHVAQVATGARIYCHSWNGHWFGAGRLRMMFLPGSTFYRRDALVGVPAPDPSVKTLVACKSVLNTRSAGLVRNLRLFVKFTRRVRPDTRPQVSSSSALRISVTTQQRKGRLTDGLWFRLDDRLQLDTDCSLTKANSALQRWVMRADIKRRELLAGALSAGFAGLGGSCGSAEQSDGGEEPDEPAQRSPSSQIELSAIPSPILLSGDARTAFRDPTAVYHDGVFWLYYSYVLHEDDGKSFNYTAFSKSSNLVQWSEPKIFTPRDASLNFCAPGNIVRYSGEWVLCLQTYPRPEFQKFGTNDARCWIRRSSDLENWSEPEMLMLSGPDVLLQNMGRMIDPYLIEDKDEPGKWWCFFDTNAANMSYSYDLKTWTYFNRVESGENVCILIDNDEYLMFHSPKNGIGVKRSPDLKNWRDEGQLITLGQKGWPWAMGRLSAGFVLDLRLEPTVGKYLMFFHGTGPEDERTIFNEYACLGIAWSDDLVEWIWPV